MRILYIDIDSLRADHLGCYGYHRKTSPTLDQLAAEGVRFTNYYTSDSPCLPSRTALFTGRFGIQTGVIGHGGRNADMRHDGPGRGFATYNCRNTLAAALRKKGWYPASITPFPNRHAAHHVWEGFYEMFDTGQGGQEKAHVVLPYVERWLKNNLERDNWFLHVNFWDPHCPYDVPLSYGNPFEKDPPAEWLTQEMIDQHRKSYGYYDAVDCQNAPKKPWLRGPQTIRNREDWKELIDGYDVGIHYADHHVGKIVSLLKEQGIYEDTAIIISSDHGENMGELEIYADHQTADHFTNNVPLIIRWPGITDQNRGKAFDGFHYNVDFSATLLDLVGGTQPVKWDGESFSNVLKTGKEEGRDFLVLGHGAGSCQRSIRWKDYILIRTYDTGNKNLPTWMLFDLKNDPHETRNLASEKPEILSEGRDLMEKWVEEQLRRSGHPDPILEVIENGGPLHANAEKRVVLCERLRATGRAHHAEWLEKHGGIPRDDPSVPAQASQATQVRCP